jgi:lipoprotein
LFLNGKDGGADFDFHPLFALFAAACFKRSSEKNKGRLENKDKSGRVYLYSKRPFKRFPA